MPEETQYLGRTPVEQDGYMEPDRHRVKCKCLRCGRIYKKLMPKGWKLSDPDPPCPNKLCKEAIAAEAAAKEAANVEAMIETGKTPGHIGQNVQVKAIDQTAQIVMEDFGMTDLKDNTRAGESMVPALTPRQQAMSKDFWGGGKLKDRRRNPTYQKGIETHQKSIVDNAMAGSYLPNVAGSVPRDSMTGDNVLRAIHANRYKPPVNIIYDANTAKKQK